MKYIIECKCKRQKKVMKSQIQKNTICELERYKSSVKEAIGKALKNDSEKKKRKAAYKLRSA